MTKDNTTPPEIDQDVGERLPGDKPKDEQEVKEAEEKKAALTQSWIWITLSVLTVILFAFLMYSSMQPSLPTTFKVEQREVIPATTTAQTESRAPLEEVDLSLLPKYGLQEKSTAQREADRMFVDGILSIASSTEDAVALTLARGWQEFHLGNTDTAMRRFNQAWLLETKSAEVHWGMAVVEGARGNLESSLLLFSEALALDGENAGIYCDLGNTFFNAASKDDTVSNDMLLLAQDQYLVADKLGHTEPACYANLSAVSFLLQDEKSGEKYERIAEDLAASSEE